VSNYELVLIISPEITDEEMPDFIAKLGDLIGKVGGTVEEINQWGRRQLAYPIKRFAEGNYVLSRVKLKPNATKDLEANFRLSGKILRHLLIKLAD
jgi:small subunit ribosomal protein S6